MVNSVKCVFTVLCQAINNTFDPNELFKLHKPPKNVNVVSMFNEFIALTVQIFFKPYLSSHYRHKLVICD